MKKLTFLIFIFFIIFFTSGCTKDIYTISVDKDNNISISNIFGIKKSVLEEFQKKAGFAENNDEFQEIMKDKQKVKEGITSQYPNAVIKDADINLIYDEFIGFTQKVESIAPDKFTSEYLPLGLKMKEKTLIKEEPGFIKDKYSIHLEYNEAIANFRYDRLKFNENNMPKMPEEQGRKITYNDDGSVTIESRQIASGEGFHSDLSFSITIPSKPEYKVIIQIPVKATETNATNVLDNNTYEWDLFGENPNVDIYIEYEKFNDTLGIIGLFISIVILLIIIGFIYIKNANDVGF